VRGGPRWPGLALPLFTPGQRHGLLQEARALPDLFRFWAPTGRARNAHGCRRWAASAWGRQGSQLRVGANLLLVGQCRVHELAVEHAGALGVRRQKPYHKGDLELKVEGEPGKHDIRECLSCSEESKDDPVHHPFHLKAQRASVSWGLRRTPRSLCPLASYGGEGTLRISTLPVDPTRAGEKEHKGTFWKQGLISAEASVQSHSCL